MLRRARALLAGQGQMVIYHITGARVSYNQNIGLYMGSKPTLLMLMSSRPEIPKQRSYPWGFRLKTFGLGHRSEPEVPAALSWPLDACVMLGLAALPMRQDCCVLRGWTTSSLLSFIRLRHFLYRKVPTEPDEALLRFSHSLASQYVCGPAIRQGRFVFPFVLSSPPVAGAGRFRHPECAMSAEYLYIG